MKPIIAVVATSGEDRNKPYLDTITEHLGFPVLLNPGDAFQYCGISGVLLTGGGDLNFHHYDHDVSEEELKSLGRIEPERESYENEILTWSLKKNIPTLGICRGFQTMAAFAGGTMMPDIPTWQRKNKVKPLLSHRQKSESSLPEHTIRIEQGSIFSAIFGHEKEIEVNSSHHQALSDCPSSLKITARAPDGIVEAFENPGHPFWLGVQFHPERMWKRFRIFSNLFHTFMEHARRKAP